MALHGKKIGFEKVIQTIDDLVAELKQDQVNSDSPKEYCEEQFDLSDDKKKVLEKSVSDLETDIVDSKEGVTTTTG